MSSTLATERQTTRKNTRQAGVALNGKLHRLYISFSHAINEQLLGLHWFCHIQKLRLRSVCRTQRLLTGTGLARVAPVGIRPVQRFNDAALRNRWWALILNTHLLYILELTPKHKVKAFIMETGSIWYAISGPHRVTCFMAAGCEQRGRKKSGIPVLLLFHPCDDGYFIQAFPRDGGSMWMKYDVHGEKRRRHPLRNEDVTLPASLLGLRDV